MDRNDMASDPALGAESTADLDGVWSMTPADDDVRRDGVGLDANTDGWTYVVVPGHWSDVPDFSSHDGPMMYRRRFSADQPDVGRRRWLVFDGIFYQGDVWFDGAYLGDPEGYFMSHAFDVTALSRIDRDHTIAVEVTCSPQSSHKNRRNITGLWQGRSVVTGAYNSHDRESHESRQSDLGDPDTLRERNPGGIWQGVRLVDSGPVRIDSLTVVCRDANRQRAHLLLSARLDSDASRKIRIVTTANGDDVRAKEQRVAQGVNDVAWTIDLADPDLWWPRAFAGGAEHQRAQPLTTIGIRVEVDGVVSDAASRRTGLRSVAWSDSGCSINGERIFLKAANVLPPASLPAHATVDQLRQQVAIAADAGLDAIRVVGNIAPSALYDAADELGVLVLQDFPMIGSYQRTVRDRAVAQATRAAQMLAHHPSVVRWVAHDDPEVDDAIGAIGAIGARSGRSRVERARAAVTSRFPTWNRTILDRWVKRAIERVDPTRQVIANSSAVSSFLPRLPPVGASPSGQIDLTGLKHRIEAMRMSKYQPAGGFAAFDLNNVIPAIGADVPEKAWTTLTNACRPILPVVVDPPRHLSPGEEVNVSLSIVNDLRHSVSGRLDVQLEWSGGLHRWAFGGEVTADSCASIADIRFVAPPTGGTGSLTLHFRSATDATGADDTAHVDVTNTYVFTVTPD